MHAVDNVGPGCRYVKTWQKTSNVSHEILWRENWVFTYDPESKRFLPTVVGSSNLVQETINSLIISRMSVNDCQRNMLVV